MRSRRAATMLEFAIVMPVFLTILFTLFEVAYDQFLQGALESTLQTTAYQVQVGNTVNTATARAFIDQDMCPNAIGHVLSCGDMFIRVQQYNTAACKDFYDATRSSLPVVGNILQLGDYVGETIPSGNPVGPANCENTASAAGGVGFCNPGPGQYIIMTAIYLAPSFLYALVPGHFYTYGGHFVHAAIATSAFYTEGFKPPATSVNPC